MKRFTRIAIAVALFALLPAALWAQEEDITLETLAQTVAAVTERIDGLQERVQFLESIFSGPDPIELDDGSCQFAGDGLMQNANLLKYKEWSGELVSAESMRVQSIALREDGKFRITYTYSFTQDRIDELWDGCEHVSSGDWYEVDWEGSRIEE